MNQVHCRDTTSWTLFKTSQRNSTTLRQIAAFQEPVLGNPSIPLRLSMTGHSSIRRSFRYHFPTPPHRLTVNIYAAFSQSVSDLLVQQACCKFLRSLASRHLCLLSNAMQEALQHYMHLILPRSQRPREPRNKHTTPFLSSQSSYQIQANILSTSRERAREEFGHSDPSPRQGLRRAQSSIQSTDQASGFHGRKYSSILWCGGLTAHAMHWQYLEQTLPISVNAARVMSIRAHAFHISEVWLRKDHDPRCKKDDRTTRICPQCFPLQDFLKLPRAFFLRNYCTLTGFPC
mmetsp:Transcript_18870/g.30257  ORF Transcript_18870/g.30257 Transcript_18870/m.30257 type:complete len:289 (-) Transcript_18870:601-1467(-)